MKLKKIMALTLCVMVLFTLLVGCEFLQKPNNKCTDHTYVDGKCSVCGVTDPDYVQPPVGDGISGWYSLTKKTQSGTDVTGNYLHNILHLNEGVATWYETDLSGKKVTDATYTIDGDVVTLQVGLRAYEFDYDEQNKTLAYSGKINRKSVTMNFRLSENYTLPTDQGTVAFTEQLFGESLDENFYNYCPTIMLENAYTMHIWYCANELSGNITDYVAYRKGTLHSDGKWTFSERQLVLSPGASGEWDSRHACDPSVVKGEFNYKNTKYNYLMAYLGCVTSNNAYNEVGIAVAQSPEGPWVKVKEVNPIASFYESEYYVGESTQWYWGYGQPSLVSVDKGGKVLLFYASGVLVTDTKVEYWDLSNLDNPQKLNSATVKGNGVPDDVNNADFAYDPTTNRIYCINEDPYSSVGGVNWITGSNTMYYVDLNDNETHIGQTLFGDMMWNKVGTIAKSATGFERNHNMGIVTDAYGWIMDSTRIPVVYTMSKLMTDFPDYELGGQWPALHTYRLHGFVMEI